jgi:small subunit ribosomal protein S19
MKKEFTYRGKTVDALKALTIEEFAALLPTRERRKIQRGFTDAEKAFLKDLDSNNIKTHCRDMIILPSMVEKRIKIHSGKEFQEVTIVPQMIGHRLGEFVLTRKKIKHGSIGVTRESKH